MSYQAVLLVAFGGPEGPDDVMPFLENVVRGRNIPRERLLEVAEHYRHFGGKSPLNDQNRELIAALTAELRAAGLDMPVYLGNRNWHPFFEETLRQMAADGVEQALGLYTTPYGSYSSCRQYRENLEQAALHVEGAPQIDKIRHFFDHPGFIEATAELTRQALATLPADATLLFSAHSIPVEMAASAPYVRQLEETCRLVAERVGRPDWKLVWQSRSGPPHQPWLEPDILDVLKELHEAGSLQGAAVVPIGFLSDHMEVLFDLDTEAKDLCAELGVPFARAATVHTHPRFVQGLRELVEERVRPGTLQLNLSPHTDLWGCGGPDCCKPPAPAGRPHGRP